MNDFINGYTDGFWVKKYIMTHEYYHSLMHNGTIKSDRFYNNSSSEEKAARESEVESSIQFDP